MIDTGFGLEPLKAEGAPIHPDHISGVRTNEWVLSQAKLYFEYMRTHGVSEEILSKVNYYKKPIED